MRMVRLCLAGWFVGERWRDGSIFRCYRCYVAKFGDKIEHSLYYLIHPIHYWFVVVPTEQEFWSRVLCWFSTSLTYLTYLHKKSNILFIRPAEIQTITSSIYHLAIRLCKQRQQRRTTYVQKQRTSTTENRSTTTCDGVPGWTDFTATVWLETKSSDAVEFARF